jgi:hypothetical protein
MRFITIGLLFLAFSCANNNQDGDAQNLLKDYKEQKYVENRLNELAMQIMADDTATNALSPVRITEVRVNADHSVLIEYRNNTERPIDGIRLGFYCFNNFGEPVKNNGSNYFNIESQQLLAPNEKRSGSYQVNNFDDATKVYGYVRQVHFEDGTAWYSDSVKVK